MAGSVKFDGVGAGDDSAVAVVAAVADPVERLLLRPNRPRTDVALLLVTGRSSNGLVDVDVLIL